MTATVNGIPFPVHHPGFVINGQGGNAPKPIGFFLRNNKGFGIIAAL